MLNRAYILDLLDSIDVAICGFDSEHRTQFWNAAFLEFFPEHAEFVKAGETYAENLRRFYAVRLTGDEWKNIDRLIAEGVTRHAQQQQPFEFTHHGRRLRVASLPDGEGGRVRVWRAITKVTGPIPALDSLSSVPDGATILDPEGRLLVCNEAFRKLYGIPSSVPIVGLLLDEIVSASVRGFYPGVMGKRNLADDPQEEEARRTSMRNALRYGGAAFEIELPAGRWRRLIAQHDDAGVTFCVHSDITAIKREQLEVAKARASLRIGMVKLEGLRSQLNAGMIA